MGRHDIPGWIFMPHEPEQIDLLDWLETHEATYDAKQTAQEHRDAYREEN